MKPAQLPRVLPFRGAGPKLVGLGFAVAIGCEVVVFVQLCDAAVS